MMLNLLHHSTIVVSDLEGSLRFYRDILGLKIVVDQEMQGHEINKILGMDDVRLRVVLLQIGEQETGLIGLLCFNGQKKQQMIGQPPEPFHHALVLTTDDIDGVYNRLRDAGENPISEPVTVAIGGVGSVKIFTCRDPNGVLVEFDQFVT